MFKVNEEKLLHDYHILDAKKHDNLAVIEKDAKAYAIEHDYDDIQTKQFVEYVVKLENSGLTRSESRKLEILSEYLEEVAEEPETAVEAQKEAITPTVANSTVTTI